MVNMILTNSRGTPVVRRSASERIAGLKPDGRKRAPRYCRGLDLRQIFPMTTKERPSRRAF
jgi:hypothetical protein